MKLADKINGPDWIIWAVAAVLVVMSVVLLSGHGGGLIAGYNTMTKEEKEDYDEKKLCRVTGGGMAVIALLVVIMGLFEKMLPAAFANVALGIIAVDCIVIIILGRTICKKQPRP